MSYRMEPPSMYRLVLLRLPIRISRDNHDVKLSDITIIKIQQ